MKKTLTRWRFLLLASMPAMVTFAQTPLSTSGNSGTVSFGTTDNVPIIFKVDNKVSGYLGFDNVASVSFGIGSMLNPVPWKANSALGAYALSLNESMFKIVAIGAQSMQKSRNISESVAIGYNAMGEAAESVYDNSTPSSNVAIGTQALFSSKSSRQNTAVGYNAAYATETGILNVAVGNQAFEKNISGEYNTVVGIKSMAETTMGRCNASLGHYALTNFVGASREDGHNTAMGHSSLRFSSSASNVAFGHEAIQNNNSAWSIGVGYQALKGITETSVGQDNIGIGVRALSSLESGEHNIAFGHKALYNTAPAKSIIGNIAIGANAMKTNTDGAYNVVVGREADVINPDQTNSIAIGYQAKVANSNSVRIGNDDITSLGGQVAWTTYEKIDFVKTDKEVPGLDFISQMRPYNCTTDTQKYHGFKIAEIQALLSEIGYDFAIVDSNGGIKYAQLIAVLVRAIQELDTKLTNMNR